MSTHTSSRTLRSPAPLPPPPSRIAITAAHLLAVLAVIGAAIGMLTSGGPGRQEVESVRGATVTLYGEGLYRYDTWLIGAGNRGQDVIMALVEVALLLAAVRWYRRGGDVASAVLTGVLSFFTYFYVSMVFGTAQNRLFPLYVAAAALAGFGLVAVAARLDVRRAAAALPDRPGRRALTAYLLGVAGALTLAWLPGLLANAATGDVAAAVGPYTSEATVALDLGVVVPVVIIAATQLMQRKPLGIVLTLIMLVLNVCIGLLLMGQGVAQLVSGVPMGAGEIVAKMLTFAVLTFVAGGLLLRMAGAARSEVLKGSR
ncbi:MAG: hypothetical protein ACTHKG_13425 [Nocardioides sp.]